jgi:hypothetical protein
MVPERVKTEDGLRRWANVYRENDAEVFAIDTSMSPNDVHITKVILKANALISWRASSIRHSPISPANICAIAEIGPAKYRNSIWRWDF